MVETTPQFSVVPIIQPGETIHSAVLRLGRLNGITVSKRFFGEILPDKKNLMGVSGVFNQSPSDLRRNHTLSPLVDLFVTHEDLSGDPDTALQLRSHRLSRGDYSNLKFCRECVRQDLNRCGYSYWRTAHQIPGVHYCWEHNSRLKKTHTSDYLYLPHEIMSRGSYDECPAPSCSTLEERYNEILQLILRVPIQSNRIQLIRALRELSNKLGYSITRGCNGTYRPSITVYLEKKYGPDITLLVTPNPRAPINYQTLVSFFRIGTAMPQSLILITAALCKSSNEALSVISDRTIRLPRKTAKPISEHALRRSYDTGRGVPSKMAEILGISTKQVRLYLKIRPFIALEDKPCRNTLKALVAFSNGQSLEQACKNHGASAKDVEDLLRDGTRYASQKIQQMLPSLA